MKRIILSLCLVFMAAFYSNLWSQNQTYQLSTHILDINRGKPAEGVTILLFKLNTQTQLFEQIDSGKTDQNGRIANFLPSLSGNEGVYKLKFETLPYFTGMPTESIYPYVEVTFYIRGNEHYHIPITISANGYSTYKEN